jgi:hypothetical protein
VLAVELMDIDMDNVDVGVEDLDLDIDNVTVRVEVGVEVTVTPLVVRSRSVRFYVHSGFTKTSVDNTKLNSY